VKNRFRSGRWKGGKPAGVKYRSMIQSITEGMNSGQLKNLGINVKQGEHWYNPDGTLRMSDIDANPTRVGAKPGKMSYMDLWLDDKIPTRAHNVPFVSELADWKDTPDIARIGNRLQDRRMGAFMGKKSYENYLKNMGGKNTSGMLGGDYAAKYAKDMDLLDSIVRKSGQFPEADLDNLRTRAQEPLGKPRVKTVVDPAEAKYLAMAEKEGGLQAKPRRKKLTGRGWKPQYYEPRGTKLNQAGLLVDPNWKKALKGAGKLGLLGVAEMGLNYIAPDNPLNQAREYGKETLSDLGLDIDGTIEGIDNKWLRGGAGIASGMFLDPIVSSFGAGHWVGNRVLEELAGKHAKNRLTRGGYGMRGRFGNQGTGLIPST